MSRAAFSWAIRSRKAVYPAAPYDLLGEDPEKNVAAGTADPGHFRSIATTRFRRLGVVLASAVSALCVVALLAKPLRGFAPLPPLVIPEPNHFLEAYLNAHFDPGKDVVMWTMATGVSPSYVPSALNWNRRRAELEMPDTVVVFCLDRACLEECARAGLRAYGGYVKDEIHIPPPSHGRGKWLKRSGAERGHTMAYIKFKAMVDMAQTSFDSLFFEVRVQPAHRRRSGAPLTRKRRSGAPLTQECHFRATRSSRRIRSTTCSHATTIRGTCSSQRTATTY